MTPRTLLLDSNLAVLLFVGLTGKGNIRKNKRLQKYDGQDFELLARLIEEAREVVFSPNVLTETSNLIRYMKPPARDLVIDVMSESVITAREEYVASADAIKRADYRQLGLTDAVLLTLLDENTMLLTDDQDLCVAAIKARNYALHFHDLRQQMRPDS